MDMNNTTLEKMQWLADKGLEPDRWEARYYFHDEGRIWSENKHTSDENNFCLPYFTESRLWSLLPDEIENSGETWTKKIEDQFCGYWCSDWTEGNGAYLEAFVYEYLIDGLLDLTIWAVKEGHLKAEVEE